MLGKHLFVFHPVTSFTMESCKCLEH